MISVLFVRSDSIYKKIGCDAWDIERNATLFTGKNVCIVHPPCALFCRTKHLANPGPHNDKSLAFFAVDVIRKNGGVLEHPAYSTLWLEYGLPRPGSGIDEFGGFSMQVDQFWFGHPARKRTWLYIVGCSPKKIPAYPISLDCIQYVVNPVTGLSGRTRKQVLKGRKEVSKKWRDGTPENFARWLIELCTVIEKNKSSKI